MMSSLRQKLKIFFLIRSLNTGGTERQLFFLVKELMKNGHDVTVLTFYAGGRFYAEFESIGVNVVCLNKRGRWDLIPFVSRLVQFLRRENPDILYSFLTSSNLLSAVIKKSLSHTKVVWGIRASEMKLEKYDLFIRFSDLLESKLSILPDLIISNSEAGKNYAIKKGFPDQKMRVIENGIDIDSFYPDRKLGEKYRKLWTGGKSNQTVIGMVGRLDPIKGYPIFLEAAQLHLKKYPDTTFVCIGGGDEKEKEALAKTVDALNIANHIVWAGEIKDLAPVYNALDIFSLTSHGEGFSNAIAEAMSCGLPCVVTNVGDAQRLVGESGIVVPPNNPARLAEGWDSLLRNEKRTPEKEIRSQIENRFSIEKMSLKTEEKFQEVLK